MYMHLCVFLYGYTHVHILAENPQFCGARGGVDARFRIYAQNAAEWWCRRLDWSPLKAFCSHVKIWHKGFKVWARLQRIFRAYPKLHIVSRIVYTLRVRPHRACVCV